MRFPSSPCYYRTTLFSVFVDMGYNFTIITYLLHISGISQTHLRKISGKYLIYPMKISGILHVYQRNESCKSQVFFRKSQVYPRNITSLYHAYIIHI